MELYMGGELMQMVPYNGEIMASPSSTYFWGPPPVVNNSVKVGNIQYWNFELSSKVIRLSGQEPMSSTLFTNI
jgi:hypothetical protein